MVQSVDEDEKGIYNVHTLGGKQDEKVKVVCEANIVPIISRARDTQEMWHRRSK